MLGTRVIALGLALCFAALPAAAALPQNRAEVEAKLAELDDNLARVNKDVRALKAKIAETENELAAMEAKEDRIREALSTHIHRFNMTITSMARNESLPMEALLAHDALHQLHRRRGVLNITRKALQNNIEQQRETLGKLITHMNDMALVKRDLKETQTRLEAEQEQMEDLRTRQTRLLALPDEDLENLLAEAKEMRGRSSLDELFDKYKRRHRLIMPKRPTGAYSNLPVQGKVVVHYNDIDPETGLHSAGLTVAAHPGDEVLAMKGGRVIYSGPFKGYGYLVILEHEEAVHSLYSGFGTSDRAVGDYVHANSVLGTMPQNTETAPRFYFELRKNGRAANPASWLAQGDAG